MNQWRVNWGIHRGTLTSRDMASTSCDDESAARAKYYKVIADFQRGNDPFGYVLWFAEIRDPNNKVIERQNGYPYV
jgi:hypothetical protein